MYDLEAYFDLELPSQDKFGQLNMNLSNKLT